MKLSYVLAIATLVAITIATPTNAVSTMQKMRPVRNLRVADDGKGEEATVNKPGNAPGKDKEVPGKGEEAPGNAPGKEPGHDRGKREGSDPKTGNRN